MAGEQDRTQNSEWDGQSPETEHSQTRDSRQQLGNTDAHTRQPQQTDETNLLDSNVRLGLWIGVAAFIAGIVVRFLVAFVSSQIRGGGRYEISGFGLSEILVDHVLAHAIVEASAESGTSATSGTYTDFVGTVPALLTVFFIGYFIIAIGYFNVQESVDDLQPLSETRIIGGIVAGYACCLFLSAAVFEANFEITQENVFRADTTEAVTVTADPATALLAGILFGLLFGFVGVALGIMKERQAEWIFNKLSGIWALLLILSLITPSLVFTG